MGVKIGSKNPTRKSSGGRAEAAAAGSFGLGDAVATVAKPVANLLGIKNCAPCQRRQAMLNAMSSRASARVKAFFRKS